ncbi:MAG: purine-nucleoside phosphorylase [Actinobacteria bacterium]|nr:purine-nucleoside phosphorylase [Actinomycetota bacterium]
MRDLGRPLSRAEVDLLRTGLRGDDPVVGYLCRGSVGQATDGRVVVVTDHADLTWRSPLTGPNDPAVGPRFPSMTGIYSPNAALDRLSALKGMILMSGVVAGVRDDARVTAYEAEMVTAQGHVAVSSELVPVVVVAAHMGLRVAAVLLAGS